MPSYSSYSSTAFNMSGLGNSLQYERVQVRYAQPGDYERERYASESRPSYHPSTSRAYCGDPSYSNTGYSTRNAVPEPQHYYGPAPHDRLSSRGGRTDRYDAPVYDYPSNYGGSSTHSHGPYRTREAVHSYHTSSHAYPPCPRSYKTRTAVPESYPSCSQARPPPSPRPTVNARTAAPDSSSSPHSSNSHSKPPPTRSTKPSINLYKVLGVSRSATHEEMKKAHRKLCMMYHPDKAKDRNRDEATKMMAEINRAWDVLGDEEARKVYDESGVIQGVDL